MSGLAVRFTLSRKPYDGDTTDAHGNTTPAYADPVDLPVCGIAPGAMSVERDGTRDLSSVLYTLYCPAGTVVGIKDLITYDGEDYAVGGEPQDWTTGPWANDFAGVVVYLARQEG